MSLLTNAARALHHTFSHHNVRAVRPRVSITVSGITSALSDRDALLENNKKSKVNKRFNNLLNLLEKTSLTQKEKAGINNAINGTFRNNL